MSINATSTPCTDSSAPATPVSASRLKAQICIIAIGLLAVFLAESAAAAPPAAPVQGSDFQALQMFVGDPLLGLEPGDAGSLFESNADTEQHMASTTKSFTLLMAVEAVLDGVVSLDDSVTISWKAANIDFGHAGSGQSTHTKAGLVAGQQIRFEDLLYAMMMPSGGDASIAIAQHVAASTYPLIAGGSAFYQELVFVDMMNQRAAELGLDDTYFYNPYGGDHEHAIDNTAGEDIAHRSTPRDMVKWFDFAMQYDLFVDVAGFQGTWAFAALNDGTPFSFTTSFGYPGTEAGKGGSGGGCLTCVIAQTRRVGRSLILAYTEGQGGDGGVGLDYGFASLFHPSLAGESSEWTGGWIQNDTACVNSQRAATAVVRPNGQLSILLHGVDIDGGTLEHLNPVVVAVDTAGDLKPRTRSGGDGGRTASNTLTTGTTRPPTVVNQYVAQVAPPGVDDFLAEPAPTTPEAAAIYTNGSDPAHAVAARVTYVGAGNLAVVAETDQGIWLHSYGITKGDTIVLRDSALVGEGSLARVFSPQQTLVLTAHRDESDAMVIRTWGLDPVSGLLTNALDTYEASDIGDEFEITGRVGLAASYQVVTVSQNTSGNRLVRSWAVTHNSGEISPLDSSTSNGTATRLAMSHVSGLGDDRDIYAIASRNAAGQLLVEAFELEENGDLTFVGSTTDTLGNNLSPSATIKTAAYREGGVMVAVQPNGAGALQRLETWALDPSGTTTSITPNRIALETVGQEGLHGFCRVPGAKAEGDFLLSRGAFAVDGIRLQGWRSAPRK